MSTAGRLLSAFMVVVLAACGATFDERRPDPSPARSVAPPARTTLVIPRRLDRAWVPVSEGQLRVFMRKTLPALPLTKPAGMRQAPFRVVPAVGEPLDVARLAMARQYVAWCESRGRGRDCSGALQGNAYLNDLGKYRVAFDIAMGERWDGFASELEGLVSPTTLVVFLLGVMVSYMAMIALPTVITQVIAMVFTLVLTAYLGAETVWNLVLGWKEMVEEANAATTFSQLYAAGERYGRRIGAQVARILIMAISAAVAEGGVAVRLLDLPQEAQASFALLADTRGKLSLAGMGQVGGVAVAGNGVTVVLAPAVGVVQQGVGVAMTATGFQGGQSDTAQPPAEKKAPGQWKKVKNPVKGDPGKYQQQITGHPADEGYFVGETEFDGYVEVEDVLLEAKGEQYAKFFDDSLEPLPWYRGAAKMVEQAARQRDAVKAAGMGSRIRWHFAERKAAEAMRIIFDNEKLNEIDVVYTPPAY